MALRLLYAVLTLAGGGLAVVGWALYQRATETLATGDKWWGLPWLFSSASRSQVGDYQTWGVLAMVFGAIVMVVGLIMFARQPSK